MEKHKLEEIFNEAKFPEKTFIPLKEYPFIKSAIRAGGKHITISGPSGSGKTTVITKILQEEGISKKDVLWINAREYTESATYNELFSKVLTIEPIFEEITSYLQLVKFIVVDDFHFLSSNARYEIAKNLKLLHEKNIRFILIGISSSAEELVGVDAELGIRNDPFELKTQKESFVLDLIKKGEEFLNIEFSDDSKKQIVLASNGIPSIVHVICRISLLEHGIFETVDTKKEIRLDLRELKDQILRIFDSKYFNKVVALTKGKQQARSVHNTYFDIISTIASDSRSEIPTEFLYEKIVKIISDPKERGKKATSFYNCLNNLEEIIELNKVRDLLHYNKTGKSISIEDPSLRFYLNLLDLNKLKEKIHIRKTGFTYDVAISFAGEDREIAKQLKELLKERGLEVFYDFDQQAQLWGKDLNKTLTEVYRNDALFMVIIVSQNYPEKDWTNFEFANGKDAEKIRPIEYLLPIKIDDTHIVGLKETIGFVDLRKQSLEEIVDLLVEKVENES
ncbi:MAG: TIR domain-containing protein [Candidatus Brocadiaceae bacterium]